LDIAFGVGRRGADDPDETQLRVKVDGRLELGVAVDMHLLRPQGSGSVHSTSRLESLRVPKWKGATVARENSPRLSPAKDSGVGTGKSNKREYGERCEEPGVDEDRGILGVLRDCRFEEKLEGFRLSALRDFLMKAGTKWFISTI
jgi:hypothetical protein